MTINEARLIREVKRRCTLRRLTEVYYLEGENGHDNQAFGEDLCRQALCVLYPNKRVWLTTAVDENAQFGIDNKSLVGDFFWWE